MHRHTQPNRGHAVQHQPSQGSLASPSPTTAQPPSEPPLLLGRYRVVETRGTGGFATVHVCWDIRLQRRVAIKCMPLAATPGSSASTLQEALDEARITSRLVHPNIVTVHDFELSDGVAYLIMEYVDGLTLAELLARVEDGVLTYDECAHLLSCVANALAFAHENGVLHLDIKPSNIFIDSSANVKLGDFGMASLASAAGWEGARGGTVGYMPPEQLACEIVDERTDVFSLAVVLYQALTGSDPFMAKDAAGSRKRIEHGARPLAKVEPELAGPVSDAVAQGMSADPARRQPSIGAFADAVLPYLGDERDGRSSIEGLMTQVRGETGPDEATWEQAARVRAVERWPWLPTLAERGTSALMAGLVGMRLLPVVMAGVAQGVGTHEPALGFAAFAALGALLPRAGTVAATLLVPLSIAARDPYSPAFLVAVALGAALALWWVRAGSTRQLAGSAALAPAALGVPTAGAGLAAATLGPVGAGVTGLLGVVLLTAAQSASNPESTLTLMTALSSPATWSFALVAGAASWAASLIGRGRGAGFGIMAQVVAAVIVVAARVALPGMENAGLWLGDSAPGIAVAVVCAVLMSIAIVTLGPAPKPREDD